jgi:phosphoglycerate dehydrogenase-like enzyme
METPGLVPIAVAPKSNASIDAAVTDGGGELVPLEQAAGLIWTSPNDPDGLRDIVAANPNVGWIQLPWAGIEPYVQLLDPTRTWTCAKGVYSDPVAEHALALLLAGFRHLGGYARERTWSRKVGRNLFDARITILGGGGIAEVLVGLLRPFRCHITVVRRTPHPMDGVEVVRGTDELALALDGAEAVVVALALTPETTGILGAAELDRLAPGAWVVNVGRGAHIDTDALVRALTEGHLGGAALDVTDPEPLPDDHPLWSLANVIITPHTANTPEMAKPLLASRIADNVRRFRSGEPFAGLVDLDAGY